MINKIQVYRKPLDLSNQLFVDVMSGNYLTREYDKFFHLALRITTNDGSVFIEKRPNITVSSSFLITKYTEILDVPIEKEITYDEMLNNTQKYMGKSFNTYSIDNNCQLFVLSILKANGLGNDNIYEFVKQDTEDLFKHNPKTKEFLNYMATIYQQITQGKQYKNNRRTIKALR